MIGRLLARSAPCSVFVITALLLCGPTAAQAQHTDINFELHAHENITAANLGLPDFPSARAYTDSANDSPVDLGFTFGDVRFRVMVSQYLTSASPSQLFDFYRKPLARYGDVLECVHGQAVGAIKIARGGLTCSDSARKQSHANASLSSDHELRSGTPQLFRVVALEAPHADSTQFALLLIELPKSSSSDAPTK